MKLKDWFLKRKQRREERRQAKLALKRSIETPEVVGLDAQTSDIVSPESRFTDEYREFLKRQEEGGAQAEISREER